MFSLRASYYSFIRPLVLSLIFILMAACTKQDEPALTETKSVPLVSHNENLTIFPQLPFKDITQEMGIAFTFENGAVGDKWFPESMLGGVGFFDYNNDGYADLIAVRGHEWNKDGSQGSSVAIYKNNQGTSFTDVTTQLQLSFSGYGMGMALGDYDGDGWQDIFITAFGENKLYKNEEGRKFTDVTSVFGVTGNQFQFSTTAAFVDIDNDADLDLFVGNYLDWTIKKDNEISTTLNGAENMYPHPNSFGGTESLLYRNDGVGFVDISDSSGIALNQETQKPNLTKALGVFPVDVNEDGFIDLIVANDSIKNFFYLNDKKGGFIEDSDAYGLAYNNLGLPTAAMGIDGTWSEGGNTFLVAMGNFSGEMTSVYQYESVGLFSDIAPLIGIGSKTRQSFTFGVLFADLDLDGREDFIQANGNVEPDVKQLQASLDYEQTPQVFWHCDTGCPRRFMQIEPNDLGDLNMKMVGRGLASADIDHDGDLDLAVSSVNGPLTLFRNDQATGNHWLQIKLQDTGKNINGIGAMIKITTKGRVQMQSIMPTGSYLSQSEAVATFGLGGQTVVDLLTVTWPGGDVQTLENIKANQRLIIHRK